MAKIYRHWIELEMKEGDIGQMCQDIAELEDDPHLEYTREYNAGTLQEYWDIDFSTVKKLSEQTCKDLEDRKGVLHADFNNEKKLDF